jgi:hypothetical protein
LVLVEKVVGVIVAEAELLLEEPVTGEPGVLLAAEDELVSRVLDSDSLDVEPTDVVDAEVSVLGEVVIVAEILVLRMDEKEGVTVSLSVVVEEIVTVSEKDVLSESEVVVAEVEEYTVVSLEGTLDELVSVGSEVDSVLLRLETEDGVTVIEIAIGLDCELEDTGPEGVLVSVEERLLIDEDIVDPCRTVYVVQVG